MTSKHPKPLVLVGSSQKSMRVPRKMIGELITFVAGAEGRRIEIVDVAVVSSAKMAALNRKHLGRRGATDVISFDLGEQLAGSPLCAQIVVCSDLALSRARSAGMSARSELLLYVLHGLLHVIGYDDVSPAAARRMAKRQESLLAEFLAPRKRRSARPR